MTDIQIVILETIKELAIENNVNEDEIKYFQIAYSLASKLCKAKNNEVLDLVISYCELNSGEVIKEGDEYKFGENWKPVEHSIGYEYVKGSYKPTRRKCNC